jgi:hypothetical protein
VARRRAHELPPRRFLPILNRTAAARSILSPVRHAFPTLVSRSRPLLAGLLLLSLVLGMSCTGPGAGTEAESEPPARVYHVQLDMTTEKDAAHRTMSDALAWWTDYPAPDRPAPLDVGTDAPVHIAWRAPRYRVRLGPFASRAEAESVLDAARSAFPDAFIAPQRRRAAP